MVESTMHVFIRFGVNRSNIMSDQACWQLNVPDAGPSTFGES